MFDFDLFVIGAGSGGVRLARTAAALGAKVAVAEDRYMGGTCVNVGCVPKKLFVYASHVEEELESGKGFGWQYQGELTFDWSTLVTNKNTEISRLNGIYQRLLTESGVTVFDGRAKIVAEQQIEVNGQTLRAKKIVIATGSWPYIPEFEGADLAITSNEFFYLDQLPKSAVVLGGGYIAVEMAGILNGLGVDTTLVYRGDLFLRGFDEEVRNFVKNEVEKKGIHLRFGCNIKSATKVDDKLHLTLTDGTSIETGLLLAATGRRANTENLGLASVGISTDKNGNIPVNGCFQTSCSSIYAIGDVIGGMQLTPVALKEGMVLARHLFADEKVQIDYDNIPTAVFCQPNIATVGLSEESARETYPNIQVFRSEFKALKHTLSGATERTLMKLIVDADSQKIVGAHMVGAEAGEIIQGIAIAIKAGATKQHFDETIGIHPTAAEEFVTMRQPVQN